MLVIKTEPDVPMLIRFTLFVAKFNVFAAPKYIPFVGIVEPVGINADAVAVELNEALVPDNALLTKVTVVPSSVIALSPIALAPVNLGRLFVVPVPVTGLVKAFCLPLNVLQSALDKAPLFDDDAVGKLKVCVSTELTIAKSVPVLPTAKY